MASDPRDDERRAAFDAAATRHGLVLSAAESDSVYALADWLSEGVARLVIAVRSYRRVEAVAIYAADGDWRIVINDGLGSPSAELMAAEIAAARESDAP